MKKILAVLAVCILFASISTVTAATIPKVDDLKNDMPKIETTYPTTEGGWTGEFAGAIGNLKKVDGEWEFTASGYMAGVYNGVNRGRFAGNLYDLDETKVGTIAGYYGRGLLVGKITMNDRRAPIVGFLLHNETMFLGRIMSLMGPAPHIVGYHRAT